MATSRQRRAREVRIFKDSVTDYLGYIFIYRSGMAQFNGKYYSSYKSARQALKRSFVGDPVRLKEDPTKKSV